ncbi:MAG TPA: cation diffusion facilitator family transporter [Tepidisphaeraceae bacterium]|nr:cation diffusion facilitator family transporter [Tepidisphaeraceae bacterium]
MPTQAIHDHSHHDHADLPSPHPASNKMGAAVILTLLFVAGEIVAGLFAHSLSLLSDAGHNFTDAAALGFSWYALCVAAKPANREMTYGYHRVGIFAALINAVSLVVIALAIIAEAILRLRNPEHVNGPLMIGVAAAAIAINLLISYWLHRGAKENINVRSAYIHMLGDALSAFGVVVAGTIILLTGMQFADIAAALLIAALILWSSWGILKESVAVLLEAVPSGVDMQEVEKTIQSVSGVLGVHDLHVWTVGPGALAASVHILVAEQTISRGQRILNDVAAELRSHFNIDHTTVQVETEGHCADDMYCRINSTGGAHIGHHH